MVKIMASYELKSKKNKVTNPNANVHYVLRISLSSRPFHFNISGNVF